MIKKTAADLSGIISGEVLISEPLSRHTTYKVGGEADILVCPENSEEAAQVYLYAYEKEIPLTMIGWGSNVIAPDDGMEGIVLKMKNPSAGIRNLGEGVIEVEAGVNLIDLAKHTAGEGLSGLEPVAGIPGTVGGAVMMNAGTNEGDMSCVLVSVDVITPAGRRYKIEKRDMSLGYRRSMFKQTDWLILSARMSLSKGDPLELGRNIDSILRERMRKFPLDEANAGSVFKRPPGDYAGRLIEKAGCKGLRIGGAVVSERHANFIVNSENATADDIIRLIAEVRRKVYTMSGIYLELEQIPLAGRTELKTG
ncbi:MAG: UDP-N-acetylmuramate dehydrogenase [Bacteroidales bacterium]|nr:UDP-N-acetylmuramate dehydrogenase [Candidatus Latescibacterota bacterium]